SSTVEGASHEDGLSGINGLSGVNGLSGINGLSGVNGLSGINGLSGVNGLSAANGLSGINGLSGVNGLMTTTAGRKTASYIVKCALAANDSMVKQDQYGNNYTFAGGIGLCPAWKTGGVSGSATCMEGISACLMAHINTAGVHVPIWLDSNDTSIGWGVDRTNFPMQEGTFFGDILDTGPMNNLSKPTVIAPVAYYCDGAGFPAGLGGIVAGRLGATQSGAPYGNPFGGLCQNVGSSVGQYSLGIGGSCPAGSNADPQGGCPDGYKALTTNGNGGVWQHGITVWRNPNYTPNFDPAYVYTMSPLGAAAMILDAPAGVLSDYNQSAMLASSKFLLTAHGANWLIQTKNDPTKCVDANAAANGTTVHINACSGVASQDWTFTPQPTKDGAFLIQTSASGNRCLHVKNGVSTAGAGMETYDCNATSVYQRFLVQAVGTVQT
ncbi:MAG TPA: RICIN domain-containing protein, partial [Polyangia bacterium]